MNDRASSSGCLCRLAIAVAALLLGHAGVGAAAVTQVAFGTFAELAGEQLDSVQCRVTSAGSRTWHSRIVVFLVGDTTVAWEAFEQIEVTKGLPRYPHDYANLTARFVVSRSVMQTMIDSLDSVPEYSGSQYHDDGYFSIAFVGVADGDTIGYDRLLTVPVLDQAVRALGHAVGAVDGALCSLLDVENSPVLVESFGPADISDSVSVTLSELGEDPVDGTFVGRFVVTSHAVKGLAGPIRVVFPVPSGVVMLDASGTTCVTMPTGRKFVEVSASTLQPGGSVEKVVRFANPERIEIGGGPTAVLGGPGLP